MTIEAGIILLIIAIVVVNYFRIKQLVEFTKKFKESQKESDQPED